MATCFTAHIRLARSGVDADAEIKRLVRERTGLNVSVGCAANRLAAKAASDFAKPNGVALIERGACSFREKSINAISAGAIAVVIHNSSPGIFFGTLGSPLPDPEPVVSITQGAGLFIRGLEPVDMTWTDQLTSTPNACRSPWPTAR